MSLSSDTDAHCVNGSRKDSLHMTHSHTISSPFHFSPSSHLTFFSFFPPFFPFFLSFLSFLPPSFFLSFFFSLFSFLFSSHFGSSHFQMTSYRGCLPLQLPVDQLGTVTAVIVMTEKQTSAEGGGEHFRCHANTANDAESTACTRLDSDKGQGGIMAASHVVAVPS